VISAALLLGLSLLDPGAPGGGAPRSATFAIRPPAVTAPLAVFRVEVSSPAESARLFEQGWDVLETRGPGYLLVQGEERIGLELRANGFRVELDHRLEPLDVDPFTFAGGYRTVAEHEQHLLDVAAAHPELALVVDYGDSFLKQASRGGHDLYAVCLTKRQPGDCASTPASAKPRALVMAAIHARELTTSELAWRLIDHLAGQYGVDADVTALLDHTEVWIAPVTNPDGRAIVEQGGSSPYLQRKNGNDTLGACAVPPTSTNQHGVDLNRNAPVDWGVSSSSTQPCAATYRGSAPSSEPEEQALESLLASLFADQRGPLPGDVAPPSTRGAMLTLHSYSNLVLLPWGYTECFNQACPPSLQAPNEPGLRALAFRLGHWNGYDTGQASELLYAASGATDDWAYATLGIPAFTFEVGPESGACSGFVPAYSCQDSTFWPKNKGAFLYLVKSARQPYVSALGPSAVGPTVTPAIAAPDQTVTLHASFDATTYGLVGVGRPDETPVLSAEAYLDTPPWAGGTPIPLAAVDGSFDGTVEPASATTSAPAAPGKHLVFFRGRASAGWGPVTAAWLTVDDGPAPAVAQVSPGCGNVTGGLAVTIQGTGFVPGATVTLAGTPAAVSSLTPTAIVVTTGARAAGPPVAGNVVVTNPSGLASAPSGGFTYVVRGDANGDGVVGAADSGVLRAALYAGGPEPAVPCAGDPDGSGGLTFADVLYLHAYLAGLGPAPGP